MSEAHTACARYQTLASVRETILHRAREVSLLTIPYLYPEAGFNYSSKLHTPWQSIGSRGILQLAAKLSTIIAPPGIPFFRLKLSASKANSLPPEQSSAIDEALSLVEQDLLSGMERRGERLAINSAVLHLLVSGNCVIYFGREKTKVYGLDQYVVRLDGDGSIMELVIEEELDRSSLTEAQTLQLNTQITEHEQLDEKTKIYTVVRWEDGKYAEYQEVCGIELDGTRTSHDEDDLPYSAISWTREDGEDYGRSFGEQYLGDLKAAERLSMSLIRLGIHASRVNPLVNPSGLTKIDDVINAADGQPIPGRDEDVTFMNMEKTADMQVIQVLLDKIEQRLAFAFLLNSAIQRNGERVTAQEILYMSQEVDGGLGGTLAVLNNSIQRPYVMMSLKRAQSEGTLKQFDLKLLDIAIITGLDALGRSQELQKLDMFIREIAQTFGPDAVSTYVNTSEYLSRRAAAVGLNRTGLIRTEDEVQAMRQQAQQAQMMQQAIGPGINAYANLSKAQMEQENANRPDPSGTAA